LAFLPYRDFIFGDRFDRETFETEESTNTIFSAPFVATPEGSRRQKLAQTIVGGRAQGGFPAVDVAEGCVLWLDNRNVLYRASTAPDPSAQPSHVALDLGAALGGVMARVALDRVNRKIYWSTGAALGTVGYDGSGLSVLFADGTDELPLNILAVDGNNRWFYGANRHHVWRSGFDDPRRELVLPPSAVPRYGGVAVDATAQLLYWIEVQSNVLMRSPIGAYELTEAGAAPEGTEVFAVSLPGSVVEIVLVTSTDESAQKVAFNTVARNRAKAAAPQMVADAHQAAVDTHRRAQTELETAHAHAGQAIADKQQEAADRRAQAQADARQTQAEPAQRVAQANAAAAQTQQQAKAAGQNILAASVAQAADAKFAAEVQLQAARRRLQNS
jgi:hypothetical protein